MPKLMIREHPRAQKLLCVIAALLLGFLYCCAFLLSSWHLATAIESERLLPLLGVFFGTEAGLFVLVWFLARIARFELPSLYAMAIVLSAGIFAAFYVSRLDTLLTGAISGSVAMFFSLPVVWAVSLGSEPKFTLQDKS